MKGLSRSVLYLCLSLFLSFCSKSGGLNRSGATDNAPNSDYDDLVGDRIEASRSELQPEAKYHCSGTSSTGSVYDNTTPDDTWTNVGFVKENVSQCTNGQSYEVTFDTTNVNSNGGATIEVFTPGGKRVFDTITAVSSIKFNIEDSQESLLDKKYNIVVVFKWQDGTKGYLKAPPIELYSAAKP